MDIDTPPRPDADALPAVPAADALPAVPAADRLGAEVRESALLLLLSVAVTVGLASAAQALLALLS